MGVWCSFVGLAALLQIVNRFAPLDGLCTGGESLLKLHHRARAIDCIHPHRTATTYPSDSLTIPTCNTTELVFAWNIKQSVYDMVFEYTCINPNGVRACVCPAVSCHVHSHILINNSAATSGKIYVSSLDVLCSSMYIYIPHADVGEDYL